MRDKTKPTSEEIRATVREEIRELVRAEWPNLPIAPRAPKRRKVTR